MSIRLLSGLSDIASDYDALICDLWGVVHDGARVHDAAADALSRFRRERGKVVLLTNAPRMPETVARQLEGFGVPKDCYDAIVSSGMGARAELERRATQGATAQRSEATALGGATHKNMLPLYYIGTDNENSIFQGLDVRLAPLAEAELVLCGGLRDDLKEVPADYEGELAAIRARGLTMICANPDLMVHRGPRLCWCAGALARDYQALGGEVIYYGKPHGPVYDLARAAAGGPRRPLVIGDGAATDIRGANAQGLDALFIAEGVHGKDVMPYTAGRLVQFLAGQGVHARAALPALKW